MWRLQSGAATAGAYARKSPAGSCRVGVCAAAVQARVESLTYRLQYEVHFLPGPPRHAIDSSLLPSRLPPLIADSNTSAHNCSFSPDSPSLPVPLRRLLHPPNTLAVASSAPAPRPFLQAGALQAGCRAEPICRTVRRWSTCHGMWGT